MKTFDVVLIRSAMQVAVLRLTGKNRETVAEVAFAELPPVEGFKDCPEMASYEIEKITEVKCKTSGS